MGQCLRKACPCLLPLCQRIFGPEKPTADGADGGTDGGSERRDADPASGNGSLYRALWAFRSRQGDELSFQEGDMFKVLSRRDGMWSVRRIDGNGRVLDSGLVPGNYLAPAESFQTQP